RGARAHPRRRREEMLFDRDLGPGVERLGVALALLGREDAAPMDAVVAAGRREGEALDAQLYQRICHALRALEVHLLGELRVLLAHRVADQRRQQDDVVRTARRLRERLAVPEVT